MAEHSLDSIHSLDSRVLANLRAAGILQFFPVQRDVIPILLAQNSAQCIEPQDICVSAPTGSGKTLSYAVPIVNTLLKDSVARLRALVLLPSRELANQVYDVFQMLVRNTDLKVAVATGQADFEQEQRLLMGPFAAPRACKEIVSHLEAKYSNRNLYSLAGDSDRGQSNVDILVCTSGRLLDHLQLTKGFTLQHLRFLVLDEADRMLGNAYHGWVRSLIQSTTATTQSHAKLSEEFQPHKKKQRRGEAHSPHHVADVDLLQSYQELRPPLQRLLFSATLTDNPSKLAMLGIYSPLLIHSSSYGPPKAAALTDAVAEGDEEQTGEAEEEVGDGKGKFALPSGLSESRIVCESEHRPITLVSLILEALAEASEKEEISTAGAGEAPKNAKSGNKHQHRGLCGEAGTMCIVFTSSVEETHRLCKLLQLINGQIDAQGKAVKMKASEAQSGLKFRGRVEEMSRTVRADDRTRIMEACKAGQVAVLVSSDHLARGIDLPNIRLVINYDPPKHVKTYVHRAGRTARAGRTGHCVTILNVGQMGAFRKLRGQVDETELTQDQFNATIKKCSVRKATEEGITDLYKRSIKRLPSLLSS